MKELVGFVALACLACAPASAGKAEADTIQPQDLAAHVSKLASDEFEGRAPGTHGEKLTVEYLAAQFKQSGLEPGNPDGTYFQKVPLVGFQSLVKIEIEAGGQKLELKFLEDFVHEQVALRTRASAKNVGVVFAGFGITAPMYDWDDYRGVDVRNKLVIVRGGEPPSFKGEARTWYSTRQYKFEMAAAKGAAGILVVTDLKIQPGKERTALERSRGNASPLICGLISSDAARQLQSMAGARANISVENKLRKYTSRNVVARIRGSDPELKEEYVMYTAHWDHLGRDSTLAGDQIYNGAIDNAVGTAQLLEIARGFARLPDKPRRSLLFVVTTAEEKGYLGARYYTQNPLVPLARTVANINLDGGNAWGVTTDLISSGHGLSTLDETLAEAARLQGRNFITESLDDGSLYFASDQIEFAKVGVPAVFPFSGFDYVDKPKEFGGTKWEAYGVNDYHQVSDQIRPDWDLSGAARDAMWMMSAGRLVAESDQRPHWKPGSEFAR